MLWPPFILLLFFKIMSIRDKIISISRILVLFSVVFSQAWHSVSAVPWFPDRNTSPMAMSQHCQHIPDPLHPKVPWELPLAEQFMAHDAARLSKLSKLSKLIIHLAPEAANRSSRLFEELLVQNQDKWNTQKQQRWKENKEVMSWMARMTGGFWKYSPSWCVWWLKWWVVMMARLTSHRVYLYP